jgi:ribosomal-protein-alanine N-acetyltransferase
MPYMLAPMESPDIAQVADIDRQAFPTLWPPTSYVRELKNRHARYLVCVEEGKSVKIPRTPPPHGLFDMILRKRQKSVDRGTESRRHIVGFVGLWFLANEAHIVSVAVRQEFKNRGVGELLILGALELAVSNNQRLVTLEVRVSNENAKRLYLKYGFSEMGVRPRYYVDNNEDALIMSTEPIDSVVFQYDLNTMLDRHLSRYGISRRTYT